ncbi:hypothetical protein D3C78_1523460 [compost metagenome]
MVRPSAEWRYFSICVASVLPPGACPPKPTILPTWATEAWVKRLQSMAGLWYGVRVSSRLRFSMNSRLCTISGAMLSKLL